MDFPMYKTVKISLLLKYVKVNGQQQHLFSSGLICCKAIV